MRSVDANARTRVHPKLFKMRQHARECIAAISNYRHTHTWREWPPLITYTRYLRDAGLVARGSAQLYSLCGAQRILYSAPTRLRRG